MKTLALLISINDGHQPFEQFTRRTRTRRRFFDGVRKPGNMGSLDVPLACGDAGNVGADDHCDVARDAASGDQRVWSKHGSAVVFPVK